MVLITTLLHLTILYIIARPKKSKEILTCRDFYWVFESPLWNIPISTTSTGLDQNTRFLHVSSGFQRNLTKRLYWSSVEHTVKQNPQLKEFFAPNQPSTWETPLAAPRLNLPVTATSPELEKLIWCRRSLSSFWIIGTLILIFDSYMALDRF